MVAYAVGKDAWLASAPLIRIVTTVRSFGDKGTYEEVALGFGPLGVEDPTVTLVMAGPPPAFFKPGAVYRITFEEWS